jgi:hypothetical protein
MFRMIGIAFLLSAALAPAYAQAPSEGTTTAPDKRAETSPPPTGVIRPAPEASPDTTVRPPNVDPAMTIPPPGTPGGNRRVDPK